MGKCMLDFTLTDSVLKLCLVNDRQDALWLKNLHHLTSAKL